ncbi:hypothetical protein CVV67_21710 [Arthrobacter stackebrandtii]|nr:hypothetical protein CVV67_21710 [Arthrobacter stackebrandtii]
MDHNGFDVSHGQPISVIILERCYGLGMTHDPVDDTVLNFDDTLFGIRPNPSYRDLMRIDKFVEDLGYRMPMLDRGYSLEEVKEKLRTEGPSAFLNLMWVQEDISPKAPPNEAWMFVAKRLAKLGPSNDLIIIDPYLFPKTPSLGVEGYAKYLAELISPVLTPVATVTSVVNKVTSEDVMKAVQAELAVLKPGVSWSVKKTEHFHDRFWITDRSKGVVVGASLNGLGSRVFFIDALKAADVGSVVGELRALGL